MDAFDPPPSFLATRRPSLWICGGNDRSRDSRCGAGSDDDDDDVRETCGILGIELVPLRGSTTSRATTHLAGAETRGQYNSVFGLGQE